MFDPKHTELVRALHERTLDGTLAWELVTDTPRDIAAQIMEFEIQMGPRPNDDDPDVHDYRVWIIRGGTSIVLDEFDDVELTRGKEELDSTNYFTLLNEIYQKGYRSARGTDAALDSILKALRRTGSN